MELEPSPSSDPKEKILAAAGEGAALPRPAEGEASTAVNFKRILPFLAISVLSNPHPPGFPVAAKTRAETVKM